MDFKSKFRIIRVILERFLCWLTCDRPPSGSERLSPQSEAAQPARRFLTASDASWGVWKLSGFPRRTLLVPFYTRELQRSSLPADLMPLLWIWSPSPPSSPRSFHNDIIHWQEEGGGGGGVDASDTQNLQFRRISFGSGGNMWLAVTKAGSVLTLVWLKRRFVSRQKAEFTESPLHNANKNIGTLFPAWHWGPRAKLPASIGPCSSSSVWGSNLAALKTIVCSLTQARVILKLFQYQTRWL